jgi:hypothetical protein
LSGQIQPFNAVILSRHASFPSRRVCIGVRPQHVLARRGNATGGWALAEAAFTFREAAQNVPKSAWQATSGAFATVMSKSGGPLN